VFIEPSNIKNCSRFNFPVILDPIIAAWLLPSPGKKEHIGETKIVARVGLIISFLLIFNLLISCLGIIVLDFIELIIVDVPKRPVRSGSSGWLTFMFNEAIPKNPDRIKINMAFNLDFFSS